MDSHVRTCVHDICMTCYVHGKAWWSGDIVARYYTHICTFMWRGSRSKLTISWSNDKRHLERQRRNETWHITLWHMPNIRNMCTCNAYVHMCMHYYEHERMVTLLHSNTLIHVCMHVVCMTLYIYTTWPAACEIHQTKKHVGVYAGLRWWYWGYCTALAFSSQQIPPYVHLEPHGNHVMQSSSNPQPAETTHTHVLTVEIIQPM